MLPDRVKRTERPADIYFVARNEVSEMRKRNAQSCC